MNKKKVGRPRTRPERTKPIQGYVGPPKKNELDKIVAVRVGITRRLLDEFFGGSHAEFKNFLQQKIQNAGEEKTKEGADEE